MSKIVSKLALAAGIMLALAFTISCSDDKDDPKVLTACYADSSPFGSDSQVCVEWNTINAGLEGRTNEQLCAMFEEDDVTMIVRESCPSGQKLKCPQSSGTGVSVTIYVYGTLPDGFTCASMDDDD